MSSAAFGSTHTKIGIANSVFPNPQVKIYFKYQEGEFLQLCIPYTPTQSTPSTRLSGQSGSQPGYQTPRVPNKIGLVTLKLFPICHNTQKKRNIYPQKDHKGTITSVIFACWYFINSLWSQWLSHADQKLWLAVDDIIGIIGTLILLYTHRHLC